MLVTLKSASFFLQYLYIYLEENFIKLIVFTRTSRKDIRNVWIVIHSNCKAVIIIKNKWDEFDLSISFFPFLFIRRSYPCRTFWQSDPTRHCEEDEEKSPYPAGKYRKLLVVEAVLSSEIFSDLFW